MAKRSLVLLSSFAVLVLACGGSGASTAPTSAGASTAVSTPAHSVAASVAASHAASPAATTSASTSASPAVTQMVTRFGAKTPPDVFYVNGDTVLDWANESFLLPLDDYIAKSGIDMTKFFPGYQSQFMGTDGKTYGIAKDGNTIAMAYNTDL